MDENKTLDPKLQEALKDIWDSLTDEQKAKAKDCKTPDELTALAAKESVELPDEVLDAVAGGYITTSWYGPRMLYEAVMDDTGKKIGRYTSQQAAENAARNAGQSTQMVDPNFVKNLRSKSGGC